jgi:hypothetical protein
MGKTKIAQAGKLGCQLEQGDERWATSDERKDTHAITIAGR